MEARWQQERGAATPSAALRLSSKLRASCLERVRASRGALLASLRAGGAGHAAAPGAFASAVRGLLAAEVTAHQQQQPHAAVPELMDADALWAAAAPPAPPSSPDEDELLRALEASLEDEMRAEESSILAEYERSLAEERAAADTAAEAQSLWEAPPPVGWFPDDGGGGGGGEGSPVACPVCRTRRLFAHRGVLFCACAGLRLDLGREGAGTLRWAAARLGEAWGRHARGGCRRAPAAHQQDLGGGQQGLVAGCDACGWLAVVL